VVKYIELEPDKGKLMDYEKKMEGEQKETKL